MITLTLTLANGITVTSKVKKMPRYWKSHLMQRAPYLSDYRGAIWSRTRNDITITSYSAT